jgi:cell wall-associated NlpC family hydrolase
MKIGKWLNLAFYAFVILFVIYIVYNKIGTANISRPEPSDYTSSNHFDNSLNDSIVTLGTELLGTPYVTAGTSRAGFDCSGFIYYVFQNFDIKVPRSTSEYEYFGTEIPIEQVRKGDLLLFLSPTRNVIGHIGVVSIANGGKSDFIHATSGRQKKVVTSNMATEGYSQRFVKAIRVQ